MRYRAKVPLRIDFGGAWTDVPVFAQSDPRGGAALSAAIALYATGYIIWSTQSDGTSTPRILRPPSSVVRYELDAPAGAGLGASAAETLLWLTLVKTTIANVSERRELAERAWRVENELETLNGKQDHYASAVGGISYMAFGDTTQVESLRPGFPFTDDFERRLVLVYTGRARLAGDIRRSVWERYQADEQDVITALQNLRRIASEMREALMAHDLEGFGKLMNENWASQQKLDASISTDRLDSLTSLALKSGAIGAKATGTGGGGCLLCLAEDGAEARLAQTLSEAGAKPLPVTFDWYGVHLTKG